MSSEQGQTAPATFLVGTDALAAELAARLAPSPDGEVTGCFDDRRTPRTLGDSSLTLPPRLGSLSEAAAHVRRAGRARVYVALPLLGTPRLQALLAALRDTTASVYFVPDTRGLDLIQPRLTWVGGLPALALCETPLLGWRGAAKRGLDIALAGSALVVAAPLLLLIALAIRLESPGPAIFRQRRHGLDGREVVVYKFRSMRVCEDGAGLAQATRNDARLTRLGGFLRASSLDELPQLINVLQGRMSLVGPRPHALAHTDYYRTRIDGYMLRHKVRPGITGWAQVNGHRGETETVDKMRARVEHDLDYLRRWSLGRDLRILLGTLRAVWSRDNAY